MESVISGAIWSLVAAGGVIVIAGIGELLAERTGVINIGIEGIMAMGAVIGVLVVNRWVPNAWLGLLGAALVGLFLGILFALASVKIKANQLLVGLAFAFMGDGLSRHIGRPVAAMPIHDWFRPIRVPILGDIPVLGDGLFNHNVLVYLAYFALPVLAYVLISKTRHGLAIRATGQNPAAADASGVRVDQVRFIYTSLAGMLFAISGAYLTLALTRVWTDGVVSGRGWIAITLVFLSRLNPFYLVLGALLFGGATSVGYIVQIQNWGISSFVLGMLPYIVTMALLLISSPIRRRRRKAQAGLYPAALSLPYHRE